MAGKKKAKALEKSTTATNEPPMSAVTTVTTQGLCDRGPDVAVGRIVLARSGDRAVFDFYLCRMNGDIDIELSAAQGQPFVSLRVHASSQSHAGLLLPVASMPVGAYSLAWQFTGILTPDWASCAEFTQNDAVIYRERKDQQAPMPRSFGLLSLEVQ